MKASNVKREGGKLVYRGEEWREIPGTRQTINGGSTEHRFEASSMGRVRRVTVSVYEPSLTQDGYERVRLGRDGGRHAVHRLVAAAFGGEAVPCGMQVNHIDGDRCNNEPSNLEVVSCAENIRHAFEHGSKRTGERHPRSKLSDFDVQEIRRLRSEGMSTYSIWTIFPQVGYGHIKGICAGRYRTGSVPKRKSPVAPLYKGNQ